MRNRLSFLGFKLDNYSFLLFNFKYILDILFPNFHHVFTSTHTCISERHSIDSLKEEIKIWSCFRTLAEGTCLPSIHSPPSLEHPLLGGWQCAQVKQRKTSSSLHCRDSFADLCDHVIQFWPRDILRWVLRGNLRARKAHSTEMYSLYFMHLFLLPDV